MKRRYDKKGRRTPEMGDARGAGGPALRFGDTWAPELGPVRGPLDGLRGDSNVRSEEEAKAAVAAWLLTNGGEFRYEPLSVRRESTEWILVHAVFMKEGHEVDGPIVLMVDAQSGRVSTAERPERS